MRNLVIAAALLIGTGAYAQDKKFELKGDAAKGEATFKTLCSACHGDKGQGNGPAGGALNPKPTNFADPANAERLTPEWVYKIVRDGGAKNGKSPLMVAWSGTLKDDQVRDVSAYVLKLKAAGKAPAKK